MKSPKQQTENKPAAISTAAKSDPMLWPIVAGLLAFAFALLEIYRPALGKPPFYPHDPRVVAVATDADLPAPHPARVNLNDVEAVADCVLAHAAPLPEVLAALATG